jgi:hypothetical protein
MNKILFLLIDFLLLLVLQANAQTMQDPNNAVQLSDNFDGSLGRLTFNADNRDFCDYCLTIFFIYAEGFSGIATQTSSVISRGQHQIRNYKVMENASRIGYNYQYAMYRGNPDKKINIDFNYCLPAADEESVTAVEVENNEGYQLAFELPSDTVYACRGGIVCDDDLKDFTAKGYKSFNDNRNQSKITVYHNDGSFSEYVFKGKSLVFPGQAVKMGSPIAIVQNIADKYSMCFSTYFLDKNKLADNNTGNKHTHFRPFFQTYNYGKLRLENNRVYICEHTDEMLMQDMSKREKKNFLKNRKTDEQ